LGGQQRIRIGRLNNTDPATQDLSYDGNTVTWLRGGTSPEVWRTFFDHSTDGLNWTNLGPGTRIVGGWRLTNVALPPDGTLRARGHVVGSNDGSSWSAERFHGKAVFLYHPASRTNVGGTSANLRAAAGDGEPVTYQWLKNGVALTDQNQITGATNGSLALSQVFKPDEGDYSIVLSNIFGSVTSAVATLTVLDPFLTQHPVGTNRNVGESVSFNVVAAGSQPLSYKWYHDGAEVPGAVGPSLALQGLLGADAGLYAAVINNAHGSVTSLVADLTVRDPLITQRPLGTNWIPGGMVALHTTAVGTPPLSYQWYHDGIPVPGAVSSSLVLQNLTGIEEGLYAVAVSNSYGRVTSVSAMLIVNGATADSAFNPEANDSVLSFAVQTDGKIVVGGNFTTLDGQPRSRLARLNASGLLDGTFNPGANGPVHTLALRTDGKILIGGQYSTLGGQPRNRIGLINADGTVDNTFNPAASDSVRSLAIQANGKILVGGDFTSIGG